VRLNAAVVPFIETTFRVTEFLDTVSRRTMRVLTHSLLRRVRDRGISGARGMTSRGMGNSGARDITRGRKEEGLISFFNT